MTYIFTLAYCLLTYSSVYSYVVCVLYSINKNAQLHTAMVLLLISIIRQFLRSCFEFIAQSTHENRYIKPRKTFWRNSKQLLS